jgi:hypothetical protein
VFGTKLFGSLCFSPTSCRYSAVRGDDNDEASAHSDEAGHMKNFIPCVVTVVLTLGIAAKSATFDEWS